MMHIVCCLTMLCVSITVSLAHDRRAEVFVGYSNLQTDCSRDDVTNPTAFRDAFKPNCIYGANGSVMGFQVSWLGLTSDISYHNKESLAAISGGSNQFKH